jgi:hypothetical protein
VTKEAGRVCFCLATDQKSPTSRNKLLCHKTCPIPVKNVRDKLIETTPLSSLLSDWVFFNQHKHFLYQFTLCMPLTNGRTVVWAYYMYPYHTQRFRWRIYYPIGNSREMRFSFQLFGTIIPTVFGVCRNKCSYHKNRRYMSVLYIENVT